MNSDCLRPRSVLLVLTLLIVALLSLSGRAARGAASGAATRNITRGLDGGPALTGAGAEYLSASADGRFVAFLTAATNLGHNPHGRKQVCVKDRLTGGVTLVSRSTPGVVANADCSLPAISANGRSVVFVTRADNLGLPDSSQERIYWHDLNASVTLPVGPGMVVPSSQDLSPRTVAISADGRWIAFCSAAANLTANDTNQSPDVFVWDRQSGGIERISIGAGGAQGDGPSGTLGIAISADGQRVVFSSDAANLVSDDTNERSDIFLRDRATATTERLSRSPLGIELSGPSFLPSMSGSGERVAYVTASANLGPGQLGPVPALLAWDRSSRQTAVVSESVFGGAAFGSFGFSAFSYDGRYLAFRSGANDLVLDDSSPWTDVYVRDLLAGTTLQVNRPQGTGRSEGDFRLQGPVSISDDGTQVIFQSRAGDLVAGDDNGRPDLFVRNLPLSTTQRLNVAPDGNPSLQGACSRNPTVSADGRFVAFVSDAFNLVAGDTNGDDDVFIWDRQHDRLERVSINSFELEAEARSQVHDGLEIEVAISGDGGVVAFNSPSRNLVDGDTNNKSDLFLRNRGLGITQRVNVNLNGVQSSDGVTSGPAISADGRFVAYRSRAFDLVEGDTNDKDDVFVRDRFLQITERVSLRSDGGQSDHWIMEVAQPRLTPRLSANGRLVAWSSLAADLVPGDTNGVVDVFVRDRLQQSTTRVSIAPSGGQASGSSLEPRVSGDGERIGFTSAADNLSPDDHDATHTAYVRNLSGSTTERLDRNSSGIGGGGQSRVQALSADGRYGLLDSTTALTVDDTNGCWDLFLRDRVLGLTSRVSLGENGGQGTQSDAYLGADMSPDARFFAFSTNAMNLVAWDIDRNFDIYVRDLGGAPPSPPIALRALAVSYSSIRLDWTDTSSDEFHFVVERKASGAEFVEIGTAPANSPTFLDTVVAPDTEYVYRVLAINATGASAPSNEAFEVSLPPLPAAPNYLIATVLSDVSIRLNWLDQSTNEEGFEIQRKSSSNFETINYRPSNYQELIDDNLKPNTVYFYRIRAYNRAGGSAFSSSASGSTHPSTGGRLGVARAVNFGRVRIGVPVTRKIVVRNLDRRTGLRVTFGTVNGDFYSFEMGRTIYLAPGKSSEVLVKFDPSTKGKHRDFWELTSSDRRLKRVKINLQGLGQLSF